MNTYPLLMAPHFVHGAQTPWGGTMLRDVFMKDAPDDITGVSMEVSAQPGLESLVANGEHAGKTLAKMQELWGEALTGAACGEFPLLLKLLDVQQPFSVQVREGRNEVWVILNAEPGAKIVYGLDTQGEPLEQIVSEGRIEERLHWENVQPGDVYYIPAGMIHAIGEGILCYEIEETNDAAWRLWDWNRVDSAGNSRELHTAQAIAAADAERRLSKNEGTTVLCKGGSRTYYVSDNSIELCRLNLSGRMPLESGRMLVLTPLSECEVHWGEESMTLRPFDTVLIPAALEGVMLEGCTKVLMSSLSNREALIGELGYRAENVAGLVE